MCIITTDGRNLVGELASYDNTTNIVSTTSAHNAHNAHSPATSHPITYHRHDGWLTPGFVPRQVLKGTVERIIHPADKGEPSAEVPLGLYLVRGENVCVVGQVDEALDASINWTEVKGAVIGTTKH